MWRKSIIPFFGWFALMMAGNAAESPQSLPLNASIETLKASWQNVTPEDLRSHASNGIPAAQYILGLGFIYNEDKRSQIEGFYWAKLAAEQHLAVAEGLVGWAYHRGLGVARDRQLALEWTCRSAEQGLDESQYQYGLLLTRQFNTNGTQQADFGEAAKWYRKAAEQGHIKAMHALGDLYFYGKLGDAQRSNCVAWLQRAADLGNPESKARLAEAVLRYPNATGGKNPDPVQLLRESAKAGNLQAQFKLALRYQNGDGVQQAATEAFHWMNHAAEHEGSRSSVASEAKYRLGLMYENGEGVEKDATNAYRLFVEAGLQDHTGNPDAQFRIAQMYEQGIFLPTNDVQAVIFYYTSAVQLNGGRHKHEAIASLLRLWSQERGFFDDAALSELPPFSRIELAPTNIIRTLRNLVTTPEDRHHLGEIYLAGKVVPHDPIEAAAWFMLASEDKYPQAAEKFGTLNNSLTAEQLRDVKARAAANRRHLPGQQR